MGCIATACHTAFQSLQSPTHHADAVAQMQRIVGEAYRGVGIVEHEAEHLHLMVGNDRQGMSAKVVGRERLVGEEILDERQVDNGAPFLFGGMDKNERRNDDSFYLFLLSCAPDARLFLRGDIRLIAHIQQPFAACFFCVSTHYSHKPLTFLYAYGVANFDSCRNLTCRSRVDAHNSFC